MPAPDLHIVTFAVPWPPNYGGAIDVWNRLVALRDCGLKLTLHCFVYGGFDPQPVLRTVAAEVHYYPRITWPALLTRRLPYIIGSRKSPELLRQLCADDRPVFFEGIHTTGFADVLGQRKTFLRAHNIEHQYYHELATHGKGVKALIFRREAELLKTYETVMARKFDMVFPIAPNDERWYHQQGSRTHLLPPFHGLDEVDVEAGKGSFVLYHGDLSLGINQEAVLDLIERLHANPQIPLVIAGRKGDQRFEASITQHKNIRREADVSDDRMKELIHDAQMILVHSLHGSGMKLKIFPALYHGRFVAATHSCRTNTILDDAILYYSPEETASLVQRYWNEPFTGGMKDDRQLILSRMPGDHEKAKVILRYL